MTVPVELVLGLAESVQPVYPYGILPLPEPHPLADAQGLSACPEDRTFPDVRVPLTDSIRLSASWQAPARLYEVGTYVADGVMGGAAEALSPGMRKRVRDSFALLGVLDVERWAARGDAYLAEVLPALEAVDPEWYWRSLPEVLEVVREVVLRLAPLVGRALSEAEEHRIRYSGSRALQGIAKRARTHAPARALHLYASAAWLGRQAGDTEAVALALIGRGNASVLRGEQEDAEGCFLDAEDLARAHGHREVEGMACHDLLALAVQRNDYRSFQRYARKARAAYPPDSPRLPRLCADVACEMISRGHHGGALPILDTLLSVGSPHLERPLLLAMRGQATACGGMRGEFRAAMREAADILATAPTPRAGDVMLEFAKSAVLLGEWRLAEAAIAQARDYAKSSGALHLIREVSDVASRIRIRAGAMAATPTLEPVLWCPDQEFAGEFAAAAAELAA